MHSSHGSCRRRMTAASCRCRQRRRSVAADVFRFHQPARRAIMHFWSRLTVGAAHLAGPHAVDTLILLCSLAMLASGESKRSRMSPWQIPAREKQSRETVWTNDSKGARIAQAVPGQLRALAAVCTSDPRHGPAPDEDISLRPRVKRCEQVQRRCRFLQPSEPSRSFLATTCSGLCSSGSAWGSFELAATRTTSS